MNTRSFPIQEKTRSGRPGMVRPSDFVLGDGHPVDPAVVLRQPSLSLYCLDPESQEALFVETAPDGSLQDVPFFYSAQYEAARRVIRVPYETFHALADEVPLDSSRLILIYSTGRCGSTLVSRAFARSPRVESISEPDVLTQILGIWGEDVLVDPEAAALVRSCTVLQCAPGRARGASTWAIKFRASIVHMSDLLLRSFPRARLVYLYRGAESWARSFARMVGITDPDAVRPTGPMREMFGRGLLHMDNQESISGLEIIARSWSSNLRQAIRVQESGPPLFVARYEELQSCPRELLSAMFSFCGVSLPTEEELQDLLSKDSQEGSSLSRANLPKTGGGLTEEHFARLRTLIRDFAPGIRADMILPGTYTPQA